MTVHDYEKEVIDYLMKHYPIRKVWYKSEPKKITKDWDIRKEYNPLTEDNDDMLEEIFTHFKINFAKFDAENYFDCECPIWQKKPAPQEKTIYSRNDY